MRRYARRAVIAILVFVGWEVWASWLLCNGVGRPGLFIFPYDQWLECALWWRSMLWLPKNQRGFIDFAAVPHHPLLWFALDIASGLLVLGITTRLMARSKPQQSLYGDSQWASDQEMKERGIRLVRPQS